MTHVCFDWSAGRNLALQQTLPQKRKRKLRDLRPLPQLSLLRTPLIHSAMRKDLRLRRLWKDTWCREQCGAILSIWRVKFFSGTLKSIMILFLVFLICKPQQLKSMVSWDHSSSLMWPESVDENSWGLREYYVAFLYLATNISPVSIHLQFKEMQCLKKWIVPLFKATNFSF